MAGRLLSRRCENRGRRDAEEDQINMSGPSNRASVLREKFTLVADRCNEVYRQDLKQPVVRPTSTPLLLLSGIDDLIRGSKDHEWLEILRTIRYTHVIRYDID